MALARRLGTWQLTATSTVAFGAIHVASAWVLKEKFAKLMARVREKDKENINWKVACRITAMLHALGICYLGVRRLASPGLKWEWLGKNASADTRILAFSLGFFLQDFAYIAFKEYDKMFFLHHVAVLAFLVSSLWTKAAALTCITGLALGEATNIFQNSYWTVRALKFPRAQDAILPVFNLSFLSIRLVLAPLMSIGVIRECLSSGGLVGRLYAILGTGLNLGGFLWAKGLVRAIFP